MKRFVLSALLVFCLCFPVWGMTPLEEVPLENGQMLVWRNPQVFFLINGELLPLQAVWFEGWCKTITEFWQHYDVVINAEQGIVITSTPQYGAGDESTLRSRVRSGTFDVLAIVETDVPFETIVENIDAMQGLPYGGIQYQGQQWDILLFCGKVDIFRRLAKGMKLILGDSVNCMEFALRAVGHPNSEMETTFGYMNKIIDGELPHTIVAVYDIVNGELIERVE